MTKLTVFASTPSGTEQEKTALFEIVQQINDAPMGLDVYLHIWTWDRNSADRIGRPAQENIDHQLPEYDIYIGIMSTRFGTPTGGYGSGTEAEFREALRRAQLSDVPWVQFYFREKPPEINIVKELPRSAIGRQRRPWHQKRVMAAYQEWNDAFKDNWPPRAELPRPLW